MLKIIIPEGVDNLPPKPPPPESSEPPQISRRKIGIAEAAETFGVRPSVLFDFANKKLIPYIPYSPEGRMLFYQDEILKHLEEYLGQRKEKETMVQYLERKAEEKAQEDKKKQLTSQLTSPLNAGKPPTETSISTPSASTSVESKENKTLKETVELKKTEPPPVKEKIEEKGMPPEPKKMDFESLKKLTIGEMEKEWNFIIREYPHSLSATDFLNFEQMLATKYRETFSKLSPEEIEKRFKSVRWTLFERPYKLDSPVLIIEAEVLQKLLQEKKKT